MAVRITGSRIGKLLVVGTILQLTTSLLAADSPKRAPSGFTGVRGKKSYTQYDDDIDKKRQATLERLSLSNYNKKPEATDLMSSDADDEEDISNYLTDYSYKRGPMGFVGMRGKKGALHKYNYQDALNREIEKIRFNCKLYPDSLQCGNYKPETLRPLNLETTQINSEDTGELDNYVGDPIQPDKMFELKRAPVGFMGMRGKKYADDGAFLKRAPSTGFMGMRGKKTLLQYGPGLQVFDDPEQVLGEATFISKRAPANGFFGMRGKKMPGNSGFFGMRGKKGPYDFPFRGKFVGVRGKKSIYDAPNNYIDGSASRLE